MITTYIKLSFAGIRSRTLAHLITVVLCMASAATIVLTLEVRGTAVKPWERTFAAAHGAHVLVSTFSETDARAITSLPNVAEFDDPVPTRLTTMTSEGREVPIILNGLKDWPGINTPVISDGAQLQEGGIILERSFARVLGVQVGSVLTFTTPDGTLSLPITGTAISPSQSRYPRSNPGIGWVTETGLDQIAPDHSMWHWQQAIRLTDPSLSGAFEGKIGALLPGRPFDALTWQEQRNDALNDSSATRLILTTYTVLLLMVLYSVTAILISERANTQYREIGLLKAVGFTPRQISLIFLLESASLGLIAVVVGSLLGIVLAPTLAAPSAETLLDSPAVAANPLHILMAAMAILPVLLVSAILSTRRSTRFSVLQTIRAGTTQPASRSRLAQAITKSSLPLPVMLGLKDLLARQKRTLWLMGSIAVTGSVIVTTLSVQANINGDTLQNDIPKEFPILFYTLDIVLILIMVTTLIAVGLLSVRERTHDFGVLKTIGLTPKQIASSVISTHTVLAIAAATLSLPLGGGLYYMLYVIASGTTDGAAQMAPWWWLVPIPVGVALLAVLATAIPARMATKITSAAALRYE